MFLSSSICPQMSQRVVILRTIVRHPFQCLLASQFDDIHLWGRIIAFSTCITVIGPLCSPQSIQRPNWKCCFAKKGGFGGFCWSKSAIQKGKKKNPAAQFLWSLPHSTHSIHGITAATVTTEPKKYTKTTITVSLLLCPKMHASKDLLKFNEPWLSHDQSGGIEFSCWRSCAADHRWAGFGQASIAEAVFSDTCQVLSEDGFINSSIFDFYKSLLQKEKAI